jgi:hypothetical protein
MIASLLLALLVTFSGTLATYLYDENASFGARLCAGAALGLSALGLVSFVVASFVGLSGMAVFFSTAICCSPLALLTDAATLERLKRDLDGVSNFTRQLVRPDLTAIGYFVFYAVAAIVLGQVFSRAVIEDSTGLSTGLLNNFGDLSRSATISLRKIQRTPAFVSLIHLSPTLSLQSSCAVARTCVSRCSSPISFWECRLSDWFIVGRW